MRWGLLLLMLLLIVAPARAQPTTLPTTKPASALPLRQANPNALYPLLIKHEHAAYQRLLADLQISDELRTYIMERSRAVQFQCDEAIRAGRHDLPGTPTFLVISDYADLVGMGRWEDWRAIYGAYLSPRARALRKLAYVQAIVDYDSPLATEATSRIAGVVRTLEAYVASPSSIEPEDRLAEWERYERLLIECRKRLAHDPDLTIRCIDAELAN